MPKYIDADALRKWMEQIAEESKPAAIARPMREDTPSELLRYGTARAMIEWLDEIPAADVEPKQKWVSVEERLPEYPGRFMCVYEDGEYGEVGLCIDWGLYDPDDGWYVSGVTHWMPLPEPPKETKDNEEDTAL